MGAGLWVPCAVPSVGVLCFRAWWEASSESPWVFRRCLPPARPEKAKPFQAGRSPCTKHRQTVRLCLYAPKKFLRVPRGGFSKTLLGRVWDSVPQKESEPVCKARLFNRDKVPALNTDRLSGFAFTNLKKFLRVPRGVFSKTRPWQGVGQRPTESEKAYPTGHAFSGGTKSLHETPTDRPASPLHT